MLHFSIASSTMAPIAGSEILVSFQLPRSPVVQRRLLCFRASVRHLSMADTYSGWLGVSFEDAFISEETGC